MSAKANPQKGNGEFYRYCPVRSGCKDFAEKQGWNTYNCIECEVFKFRMTHDDIDKIDAVGPVKKFKRCSKCGADKVIDDFPVAAGCKDGHANQCKECRNKYFKQKAAEKKTDQQKPVDINIKNTVNSIAEEPSGDLQPDNSSQPDIDAEIREMAAMMIVSVERKIMDAAMEMLRVRMGA